MNDEVKRVIKKYPNRRLYDTAESKYVTLQDVRKLVLDGVSFCVIDKKSGEDITRNILLQIIIEQEEAGEPLFSTDVLEQLIGFYGNSVQGVAGDFISQSLNMFQEQQQRFQNQMREAMESLPMPAAFSEMAKQNFDMWRQMQDSFFKGTRAPARGTGRAHELAQRVREKAHQLGERRPDALARRGRRLGAKARHALRQLLAGVVGQELVQQLRTRDSVGQRVMDLADGRDAPAREPFHEHHLPERLCAVERPARDLGDDLRELLRPARRGRGHAPHVVVEVDFALEEDRVMQRPRRRHRPPAERRHAVETRRELLLLVLERVAAGPRVVDADLQRVHVLRRRLAVEEQRVRPVEPLHDVASSNRGARGARPREH